MGESPKHVLEKSKWLLSQWDSTLFAIALIYLS